MPFHLGSLGFLTNFDFANYRQHLTKALEDGIRVNLRMRFTCTVYRRVSKPDLRVKAKRDGATGEVMMQNLLDGNGSWEALERDSGDDYEKSGQDKDLPCYVTQAGETFEVLNDLVVDRGAGPYMSMLELFGKFTLKY
jgi:NAD+ kinase